MNTRTFILTVLTAGLLAATAVPAMSNSLSDLATLQAEYAKLIDDYRKGHVTLSDLVEFQRKLAIFRDAFIAGQPEATYACSMSLMELQSEWARLVEMFKIGKATLQDLAEFQRKLAAFRECYAKGQSTIATSSVVGSGIAAVEAASWGLIKSSYKD